MQEIRLSDGLWGRVAPLLPKHKKSPLGGRPRLPPRKIFEGILFIKSNKLPWRAAPRGVFGSKTALNDYYRYWAKEGVFHVLREKGILLHPELAGTDLDRGRIEGVFGRRVKP